jgi:hypothetical protein
LSPLLVTAAQDLKALAELGFVDLAARTPLPHHAFGSWVAAHWWFRRQVRRATNMNSPMTRSQNSGNSRNHGENPPCHGPYTPVSAGTCAAGVAIALVKEVNICPGLRNVVCLTT